MSKQQHYGSMSAAPKSPGLALVASFFIPGLGSLVNGRIASGIAIFAMYCISFGLMVVAVGFITAPAVWVVGMWDAYTSAKEWNARHGIVS